MRDALLDLGELGRGNIPALTAAMGAALAEAGSVCLESQGHSSGAMLAVRGYAEGSYTLTWSPVSEQSRNLAYNDAAKATEMGAEGIAVLVARVVIGYEVIRRSRRGDGFDY